MVVQYWGAGPSQLTWYQGWKLYQQKIGNHKAGNPTAHWAKAPVR